MRILAVVALLLAGVPWGGAAVAFPLPHASDLVWLVALPVLIDGPYAGSVCPPPPTYALAAVLLRFCNWRIMERHADEAAAMGAWSARGKGGGKAIP